MAAGMLPGSPSSPTGCHLALVPRPTASTAQPPSGMRPSGRRRARRVGTTGPWGGCTGRQGVGCWTAAAPVHPACVQGRDIERAQADSCVFQASATRQQGSTAKHCQAAAAPPSMCSWAGGLALRAWQAPPPPSWGPRPSRRPCAAPPCPLACGLLAARAAAARASALVGARPW